MRLPEGHSKEYRSKVAAQFQGKKCPIFVQRVAYTDAWSGVWTGDRTRREGGAMMQNRMGAFAPLTETETRRWQQVRRFRRNQIFGVLLVAAAILLAALLRTNPRWIFTPGWWRP
jgi:hypothetical protein